MRRHVRLVLLAVASCLLLVATGCSLAGDLAKGTYTRTTVPAPGTGFEVDRLRVIDPCGLLDRDLLSQLGTPAESRPTDYTECANYMKDAAGNSLSVNVRVGERISATDVAKADKQIGGLAALVDPTTSGACFINVVTQVAPPLGIRIHTSAKNNPCDPAKTVAEAAVTKIRSSPPVRTVEKGSLIRLDACMLVDAQTVNDGLPGATESRPSGMHQCEWKDDKKGLLLGLTFKLASDPNNSGKLQPVDVGGVTVYQDKSNNVYPVCTLTWSHRKAGDKGEVVAVRFDNILNADVDACAKVKNVVAALLPKLPKP